LDEDLAAGQISADDYRRRRDNVLSSAVSLDSQNSPSTSGEAESTQIIAPLGGDSQPMPPGPGQPQQPVAEQETPPDRTQIVTNAAADSAEPTQVSRGEWQTSWPATSGDAERTQVVSGVPPQAVAGTLRPPPGSGPASNPHSGDFPAQPPPQYQQPWNSPSSNTRPPWGGTDFPPLAPATNHDWVGQGPEVFKTSSSNGMKRVLSVVAVVVIAALGVAAFLLFSSTNSDNTAQQPPAGQPLNATPAPPPRPKDDLEIATLPGSANEVPDVSTFSDVIARKALTPEENNVYSAVGASKCRLAVSSLPSNINALVLTVQTSSPEAAVTARDGLDQLQIKYGMQAYTGTAPPGVKVVQLAKAAGGRALIRAHYVHKNTVVRVHVEGNDLAEISKVFDEILAAQLQALPVGN
jgi:hypothetical protein